MKSLTNVQKVMKAFKIVTSIVMTLSIVAFALILVGIIVLATGQNDVQGSPFYHFFTSDDPNMDKTKVYYLLGVSLIESMVEAIVFGFLYFYFKKEVKEGDPFTLDGIKFLQWTGLIIIIVSAVGSTISAILNEVAKLPTISVSWASGNITLGVLLLIVSLIFKYGYDLKEKNKEKEDNNK